MKRCPLCDFIYEDDQGVCEMDGIELVQDCEALIPAGEETVSEPPARPLLRRRSLLLLLGFGLGAAIFSAYYTSIDQAEPARPPSSYAGLPAPAGGEPTPAPATPTPTTPAAETPAAAPEKATPTPSPAAPTAEQRPAGPGGKKSKPQPAGAGKKKESKLASILNKTGRMLKKPFGF